MKALLLRLFMAGAIGIISACGGGGGSGNGAAANTPPKVQALISGDVRSENGEIRMTAGGTVRLDATGTRDPDQDPLAFEWTLTSKPTSSVAASSGTGATFAWQPDVLGTYVFAVKVSDGKGGVSTRSLNLVVDNRPPSTSVVLIASAFTLNAGQNLLTTSVGYDVLLDGAASSDADGDTFTRAWALASRPAGSTAALSNTTGATALLSPDLMGDYVVTLTTTDSKGAASIYTTTVRANNRRPVAQISTNATAAAVPSAPGSVLPVGTHVTLRADASSDADGDAILFAWSVDARPAGSSAALSSTTSNAPNFMADVEGAFVFRLRTTDTHGAFSERTITVRVGTHAPVAVVDKTEVTALPASTVRLSAAMSFDADGDSLSYQWSIDAKPAGSASVLANTTADTSIVPDVTGVYVLAVRVSDGRTSGIAYVTVRVLAQFQSSVTLSFKPDQALYSKGLDRVVIASASPDALRVVDPFTGNIASIPLPTAIKNMSLSPDGKLAVVLHEGVVSLVDLQTSTLLRSTRTGGAQTDAFVTNTGIVYAIGHPGGSTLTDTLVVLDGRTGANLTQPVPYGSVFFYGTEYGLLAGTLNKVFFVSVTSSPADISYFSFDPATSAFTDGGNSPYHGDYAMSTPLFLSEDESLLFTASGTYFNTATLRYAGILSGVTGAMHSFSHSAARQEALALQSTGVYDFFSPSGIAVTYPSSYQRFTGALLLPDTTLPLPVISGSQSYGINIFHSANGKHVGLVQTGAARADAGGLAYHVIVR